MTETGRFPAEGKERTIPRWRRIGPLFVVLVAVATLAAACGGGGAPDGASSSNRTTAPPSARPSGVLYASCMRSHGVTDFPDSAVLVSGGQVEFDIPASTKSEPQFSSASRACSRDLPGGGSSAKPGVNIQEELQFANCMRSHGVTDFPDPMPGGGFDIPGETNSPQFQVAENACQARPGSSGVHVGSNGS